MSLHRSIWPSESQLSQSFETKITWENKAGNEQEFTVGCVEWSTETQDYVTERVRLDRTTVGHLVQPPCSSRFLRALYSGLCIQTAFQRRRLHNASYSRSGKPPRTERLAKVYILNHTKSKVSHPIWKEILTSQSTTATLLPAILKGEGEKRKGILDHCIIQRVLTATFGACHTQLLIILKDGYERGWRKGHWMI